MKVVNIHVFIIMRFVRFFLHQTMIYFFIYKYMYL